MMKQVVLCLTISALLMFGCKKKYEDTEPMPAISAIPKLELVSVAPTTVNQWEDSILFTVRYTDGDGDLGFAHADSMSVELIDLRFPLTISYHLQPLAPPNTAIAITGELPIVLDATMLEDQSASQESAVFQIRLKDRAGHWSNPVTTVPVTVLP